MGDSSNMIQQTLICYPVACVSLDCWQWRAYQFQHFDVIDCFDAQNPKCWSYLHPSLQFTENKLMTIIWPTAVPLMINQSVQSWVTLIGLVISIPSGTEPIQITVMNFVQRIDQAYLEGFSWPGSTSNLHMEPVTEAVRVDVSPPSSTTMLDHTDCSRPFSRMINSFQWWKHRNSRARSRWRNNCLRTSVNRRLYRFTGNR